MLLYDIVKMRGFKTGKRKPIGIYFFEDQVINDGRAMFDCYGSYWGRITHWLDSVNHDAPTLTTS
jgi:hypothetical protein